MHSLSVLFCLVSNNFFKFRFKIFYFILNWIQNKKGSTACEKGMPASSSLSVTSTISLFETTTNTNEPNRLVICQTHENCSSRIFSLDAYCCQSRNYCCNWFEYSTNYQYRIIYNFCANHINKFKYFEHF